MMSWPPRPVRWLSLAALAALTGCGGGGYTAYGTSTSMTCVPYARKVSGIGVSGDAWQWWRGAEGRYPETSLPQTGSVLVFRRTSRLPSGHLAVVSSIVSSRRIVVTQANWVPYRVTNDQPVLDVSPGNDWTAVRVWWPPSGAWGVTVYPTYGFILPGRAPTTGTNVPIAWSTSLALCKAS